MGVAGVPSHIKVWDLHRSYQEPSRCFIPFIWQPAFKWDLPGALHDATSLKNVTQPTVMNISNTGYVLGMCLIQTKTMWDSSKYYKSTIVPKVWRFILNCYHLPHSLQYDMAMLSGWWLTNPSEKYVRQIGSSSQLGKINGYQWSF